MKADGRHSGFTLIEIMIAILVLAVALIGLAAVTTTTIKGNSFSKAMTSATTLANDKLQDLKARTFTGTSVDTDLTGGSHSDTGIPCWGYTTGPGPLLIPWGAAAASVTKRLPSPWPGLGRA